MLSRGDTGSLPVSTRVTRGLRSSNSASHILTMVSGTPLFADIWADMAVCNLFENFCSSKKVSNSGARVSLMVSLHLVSLCWRKGGGCPLPVDTLHIISNLGYTAIARSDKPLSENTTEHPRYGCLIVCACHVLASANQEARMRSSSSM